jgi:Domain of unknown function (DUF5666)
MQNINRLVILGVTIAAVGFVASVRPVNAQTREARGNVTALTDSTLTLKAGAQSLTFYIDSETRLEVRRAAKEVQQAQPGGAHARVNDFFEVGQPVLVRYREEGGKNHALDIERVGSPGSGAPKESSKIAEGKVTSVTASLLTLATGGRDISFAITGDTDVLVKGATKATKAAGGTTTLATFVHPGDMVSVTYKETGGAMTASEIRVRVASRN